MDFLHSDNLHEAIGPYSQAINVNGFLYSSGQIPLTKDGTMIENDIKKQTRQIFTNIRNLLEDNNGSMNSVIKINIFLQDMNHFGIVNVLMAEAFGDHKPVRTTIEVAGLPKNAMIEMDIIAKVNETISF